MQYGLLLGVLDRMADIVRVDRRRLGVTSDRASSTLRSIWEPCPDTAYLVDIVKMPTMMSRVISAEAGRY